MCIRDSYYILVIKGLRIKRGKLRAGKGTISMLDYTFLNVVKYMNVAIAILFTLGYFYQIVYTVIGFIKRNKWKETEAKKQHKFAALICARNESEVIEEIIESLKNQNYPKQLLDIYVLADNLSLIHICC